jgi:hypothetical protein
MSETYFQNFNSIPYGNNQVVDITERAVVLNNLQTNPFVYYPQDITNGFRADQLANLYYEDPYTSWIIYLSNNILDPYYEWYLNDYQFNNYIAGKYGSVQKASEKIAYYINNWIDQNETTVAAFEAMTPGQQKYWEPIYNNFGKITSYSRKKQDWKVQTNFIVSLSITGNSNFQTDEVINIKYNPAVSGKAQVSYSNSSTVIIKSCSGDFFPHDAISITGSSYIYGTDSKSNCIITTCTFLSNNIPMDEAVYWQEQSYLEVETEKNEGNKTVRMLQPQFAPQFIRNTKQLLGG